MGMFELLCLVPGTKMIHFYSFFLIFMFKNSFLRAQTCTKYLLSNPRRLSGITYHLFCFARCQFYTLRTYFVPPFYYQYGPYFNQVPISITRCLCNVARYLFGNTGYLFSTIRCILGTTKYQDLVSLGANFEQQGAHLAPQGAQLGP